MTDSEDGGGLEDNHWQCEDLRDPSYSPCREDKVRKTKVGE